ncbi:TPA: hypothetical protein ACVI3A_004590 [Enterobacter roggenkampii]|uniref:hypothetical protein n=1 Tax=Enterobacter roggenkampii TaxID=1812935 RepID=UPI0020054524|nr:hypothetical protein [Enterobacter roggenkampii]MCK7180019.1 hypothetical protein [Enterobacter roggenkampii]
MENNLFYPVLSRHELDAYYNRDGKFYADYKSNYELVSSDCLKRCVYCDATERECGGDHFSLDHFRPRKIFGDKFDGLLIIHPYNLYLSCQKCNILKSSDWHGCSQSIDGYTFSNKKGFLDRFDNDFLTHITVNNQGEIVSLNESGPVNYMIKKLHLNRPNRVYIRYLRLINEKTANICRIIDIINSKISFKYDNGELSAEKAMALLQKIQDLQYSFHQIQKRIK